jgi:hypothetical protein
VFSAVAPKRVVFLWPEWKDDVKYAATLADQFGLEMAGARSRRRRQTRNRFRQAEKCYRYMIQQTRSA